jgi:hypothetical protein
LPQPFFGDHADDLPNGDRGNDEGRQRERQALRGPLRAVASTAGNCGAREVEYCQRSRCRTGGPRIPARRTPDSAVSERVRALQREREQRRTSRRAPGAPALAKRRSHPGYAGV